LWKRKRDVPLELTGSASGLSQQKPREGVPGKETEKIEGKAKEQAQYKRSRDWG